MNPNSSQAFTVPGAGEIREILARRVDQQKQAVGMVAGIVASGGRRVAGYGRLAQGDSRTVDGDTIFEIGSVTKVFTSLLLAEMVDRKEAALDDPVAEHLPEHVKMPERGGRSITLLDLATHHSGLPPLPTNVRPKDMHNPYAGYDVEDLYEFLSGYTLPRDPGSAFEYSNLGAGLLGHVLACRAGKDYQSLMRSRITEPLGMAATGITLSASMGPRVAAGHNAMLAPAVHWDFSALAGAGALRSTAHDMLTFLEAFLGYRESPLAPAMGAMLGVRRPAGKGEVGLGWLLLGDSAWHDGGTGGFRSFVGCDLKTRCGVVVLSNAATWLGVDDIGGHLLNPKAPLADPEPPKQRTQIAIDSGLLDRYTGRYQVTANLILEITRDGDRLFAQAFVQLAQNPTGEAVAAPRFELFAEAEEKFFARVTDKQVVFGMGPEGRVTSLTLHQAGREAMQGVRVS